MFTIDSLVAEIISITYSGEPFFRSFFPETLIGYSELQIIIIVNKLHQNRENISFTVLLGR